MAIPINRCSATCHQTQRHPFRGTPSTNSPRLCTRRMNISSRLNIRTLAGKVELSTARSHEIVNAYYDAYNKGDFEVLDQLFAEDCSYHDMIYEEPLLGKSALLAYLKKVRGLLKDELKFVVEDITTGDNGKVGVIWHVETASGVQMPFSRGCSFYTFNSQGQILSGKDWVEPSIKPGSATLNVLALVVPLVKSLPKDKADLTNVRLPVAAAAVWTFYAVYMINIFFNPDLPGFPVYQTPPETLQEIWNESINLFFINPFLVDWGLSPFPNIPSPPVSEGVFNFVLAWTMMFFPLMLCDGKGAKVEGKVQWFTAMMFLTNVFFIPYLALRAAPEAPGTPDPPPSSPAPSWTPLMGAAGAVIGVASIYWALTARPEYGDLAARWEFLQHSLATDRVSFAFLVDSCLYSIWQWSMMAGAPTALRLLPYFGLAGWLLTGAKPTEEGQKV